MVKQEAPGRPGASFLGGSAGLAAAFVVGFDDLGFAGRALLRLHIALGLRIAFAVHRAGSAEAAHVAATLLGTGIERPCLEGSASALLIRHDLTPYANAQRSVGE